jgi:hypothetical protein
MGVLFLFSVKKLTEPITLTKYFYLFLGYSGLFLVFIVAGGTLLKVPGGMVETIFSQLADCLFLFQILFFICELFKEKKYRFFVFSSSVLILVVTVWLLFLTSMAVTGSWL